MDLNARVNHMDEELKLLKNEIKQVLIEVQEHVVNLQGPVGGGAAYALSAPLPTRQPEVETVPTGSSGGGGGPIILGGGSSGGNQGGSPSGGFGMGGGFSGMPQMPSTGGGFDAFSSSEDSFDDLESLDAGTGAGLAPDVDEPGLDDAGDEGFAGLPPSDTPAPEPSRPPATDKTVSEQDAIQNVLNEINGAEPQASTKPTPTVEDDDDEIPSLEPEFLDSSDEVESELDDTVETLTETETATSAETVMADSNTDAMDLVSLAGVAQWTQSVLRKVGQERLTSLLEISEMTGRIPPETKQVVLALIPLFGGDIAENGISVKDIIMLIAQLDGFLGATTEGDTKLLPFLLQEDWEVFPLIRP